MTTISCSSCSATPTPQSLLLESLSKGELLKKGGIAGDDKGSGVNKGTDAGSADNVQISATGYQQLRQDAAGETVVKPVTAVDVYNKTGLQAPPSSAPPNYLTPDYEHRSCCCAGL